MQVSSDTACPRLLIWFFQILWCTPTLTYILLRPEVMRFLRKLFLKQSSSQRTMPVSSVLNFICDILPFNRSHPSSLSYGVSILRFVSSQVTRGGITPNHGVDCTICFCTDSYHFWQPYVFPPQPSVHFSKICRSCVLSTYFPLPTGHRSSQLRKTRGRTRGIFFTLPLPSNMWDFTVGRLVLLIWLGDKISRCIQTWVYILQLP